MMELEEPRSFDCRPINCTAVEAKATLPVTFEDEEEQKERRFQRGRATW